MEQTRNELTSNKEAFLVANKFQVSKNAATAKVEWLHLKTKPLSPKARRVIISLIKTGNSFVCISCCARLKTSRFAIDIEFANMAEGNSPRPCLSRWNMPHSRFKCRGTHDADANANHPSPQTHARNQHQAQVPASGAVYFGSIQAAPLLFRRFLKKSPLAFPRNAVCGV